MAAIVATTAASNKQSTAGGSQSKRLCVSFSRSRSQSVSHSRSQANGRMSTAKRTAAATLTATLAKRSIKENKMLQHDSKNVCNNNISSSNISSSNDNINSGRINFLNKIGSNIRNNNEGNSNMCNNNIISSNNNINNNNINTNNININNISNSNICKYKKIGSNNNNISRSNHNNKSYSKNTSIISSSNICNHNIISNNNNISTSNNSINSSNIIFFNISSSNISNNIVSNSNICNNNIINNNNKNISCSNISTNNIDSSNICNNYNIIGSNNNSNISSCNNSMSSSNICNDNISNRNISNNNINSSCNQKKAEIRQSSSNKNDSNSKCNNLKTTSNNKNTSSNNNIISLNNNNMRTCNMLPTFIVSNLSSGSRRTCIGSQQHIAAAVIALLLPMLLNVVVAAVGASSAANAKITYINEAAATQPNHSTPHFKSNRTAIVHLFEWKFIDVAKECREFLGPRGYAGVQLSPVTENLVYRSERVQRPWWERYHPISYLISSRSGNEEDFLYMSQECNKAGVRIYVDVVFNHMASADAGGDADDERSGSAKAADVLLQGCAGFTANASALDYPGVPYVREDFHKSCHMTNYNDGHEMRNCQLYGRPDLDHSRAVVRERIVKLLDSLVDLGTAGFRVDAAEYMWPIELKQIYNALKNLNSKEFDFPEMARPFFYQEIIDLGTQAVSKTEYSGHGVVTEYLYAAELATIFSGKAPLSALINWGPAMGFLQHDDAMVFVDTHDGQRGLRQLGQNHLLTHRWRAKYIMANAFMLAHPYGGIKRIMSSYRYAADDVNQGPPTVADDDDSLRSPQFNDMGQCNVSSGWVCEHRWPGIANMIELANSLDGLSDTVINFQTDGPQHIAFCRGSKAFIALNNDATMDFATQVFTCLEAGIYCDVISGGRMADGNDCRGRRVVVDALGRANISLPATGSTKGWDWTEDEVDEANQHVVDFGVIAFYVGSKLLDAAPPKETKTEVAAVSEGDVEGGDVNKDDVEEEDDVRDTAIEEGDVSKDDVEEEDDVRDGADAVLKENEIEADINGEVENEKCNEIIKENDITEANSKEKDEVVEEDEENVVEITEVTETNDNGDSKTDKSDQDADDVEEKAVDTKVVSKELIEDVAEINEGNPDDVVDGAEETVERTLEAVKATTDEIGNVAGKSTKEEVENTGNSAKDSEITNEKTKEMSEDVEVSIKRVSDVKEDSEVAAKETKETNVEEKEETNVVSNEIVEQVAEELSTKTEAEVKDLVSEDAKEVAENIRNTENISKVAEKVAEKPSTKTEEKTTNFVSKDAAKIAENLEETAENAPEFVEDVGQEVAEEVAEDVAEKKVEESVEEEVVEEVAEEVIEEISEEVVKEVAEVGSDELSTKTPEISDAIAANTNEIAKDVDQKDDEEIEESVKEDIEDSAVVADNAKEVVKEEVEEVVETVPETAEKVSEVAEIATAATEKKVSEVAEIAKAETTEIVETIAESANETTKFTEEKLDEVTNVIPQKVDVDKETNIEIETIDVKVQDENIITEVDALKQTAIVDVTDAMNIIAAAVRKPDVARASVGNSANRLKLL